MTRACRTFLSKSALLLVCASITPACGNAKSTTAQDGDETLIELRAKRTTFEPQKLYAGVGQLSLLFMNEDEGLSHNISIYGDVASDPVFKGDPLPGIDSKRYELPRLEPGRYVFRCDFHPRPMVGELTLSEQR
ncbi:MAG: cupredoxin domain-containing protein [Actinomycetota bacterium]